MMPIGHKDRTDAIVEQINRRHSQSTEVIRIEEKLPQNVAERLADLEQKCLAFASFGSAFDDLTRRVKALEVRPVAAANDANTIPVAIGKLHESVESFAGRMADVEAAIAALADGGLGESLSVTEGDQSISLTINEGDSVLDDIADICAQSIRTLILIENMQSEISSLRRRVNEIDTDVVDLVDELGEFARQRAG